MYIWNLPGTLKFLSSFVEDLTSSPVSALELPLFDSEYYTANKIFLSLPVATLPGP